MGASIPKKSSADTCAEAGRLIEAGEFDAAVALLQPLLTRDAKSVLGWMTLARAWRKLGKFDEAIHALHKATALEPRTFGAWGDLCICFTDAGRYEEAVAAGAKGVGLVPQMAGMRQIYGTALYEAGQFEKFIDQLDILHKMLPDDAEILWRRATTLLYLGNFREGWEAFEIRWKMPKMNAREYPSAQRWRGEDLTGKTLMVNEEQGFGDSILCSRYLPLLKARGARLLIECKPALQPLFATLRCIDEMAEPRKTTSAFDYHVPMMSLPGIFGTDLSNIPPVPPFHVTAKPPAEVQHLLDLGQGKLRVGIVWSGSVTFLRNKLRAVGAERFLPLADIPGVALYSLQKGPLESELEECGGADKIHALGPLLNDFLETAAAIKQLDLIIMTDSSVAHLAGSLGVPVWNLLNYRPYWLYLTGREDSPWYPSMRLFRQKSPMDWDSVFAKVAAELQMLAEKS